MKNLKVYFTQLSSKGKYNITENEKEVTRQTSSGKSYKLTKKVLAVALAATSVLSFAGCSSKKQFVLQDTLLENAVVASVSTDTGYETRILRPVNHGNTEEKEHVIVSIVGEHKDYIDIVTGEALTISTNACDNSLVDNAIDYEVRDVEEIAVEGSVFRFLTEEELKLLNEGKEDEVDFVKVLVRIRDQEEAKRKVKQ